MGRAPCCDKMGLKKGPWTAEEDSVLVSYITQNGHGNWRALPKRAGLLRCGKSCRLRWMNYLRPDIKRGNFTCEEEETIIKLHLELGNKWSVIAARLPGRTDNEIKNIWHTNLKKKKQQLGKKPQSGSESPIHVIDSSNFDRKGDHESEPDSPSHSYSENTSSTTTTVAAGGLDDTVTDSFHELPVIDESFWSEVFSPENCENGNRDFSAGNRDFQTQYSPENNIYGCDLSEESEADFWYEMFYKAEELNCRILRNI